MITEAHFLNVLKDIAVSLREINSSLKSIRDMKSTESKQIVQESKQRMRHGRINLLNESQKRELFEKSKKIVSESLSKNLNENTKH